MVATLHRSKGDGAAFAPPIPILNSLKESTEITMVMEEQHSDMELAAEKVPVPQVQKSMEVPLVTKNNQTKGISHSKPRFRKKALNAAILKQMEFYFSDSNLTKDRFLGNLIKEDPNVDLSVFIKFNKIRELTTDINRIAKALQASTILSISEDGLKVHRTTPIQQKENIEECTVYVQNLPPGSNHDWLSSVFSQYGKVTYVSIPHYKINKKIKGFAFVEFDKPEEAENCLKDFKKIDCLLPSHTNPDEILSITTFDDTEKDVITKNRIKKVEEKNNLLNDISSKAKESDTEIKSEKNENKLAEGNNTDSKKMKRNYIVLDDKDTNTEDDTVVSEPDNKKLKISNKHENKTTNNDSCDIELKNEISDESNVLQESNEVNKEVNESDKVAMEITNDTDNEKTTDEKMDEKKKKRKRKRNSKIEEDSISNIGLQVMAKKDWRYLRNKYLELQRSKMKQLKQHLKKTRSQWNNFDKTKPDKEDIEEKEKIVTVAKPSKNAISFTPGVVVKITLNEMCTDTKSLKMELKGNNVKYVDVSQETNEVYVRYDTPESAQSFVEKSNKENNMVILKDEDERAYWKKIFQDRDEKLGKNIKTKQRGRSKLLKKAEKELGKHIIFDKVE
ncbi:hypothetical protein M0802_010518 [Mischocyttarus mexicanus]|nr:hypothetical protein M0802_010518 [Mischocyttarus mexicanus]